MTNESAKKFLKVYDDVLQCKRLTIWDRLTISLAISFGENGRALFASQQSIADRLGTSRDTVKRSVANLKKLPFVNVECRGVKKSLIITVNLPLLEKWLVDMVQDAPSDMVQDAPSMGQDAPLLDNSLDHSSLKDQFELHGNFAGKIVSVSTAELIDDDSSKAEGHESKDGLPLPDELGDDYPLCKQAIKIMNRLRREECLTNIYTNRMHTRQWQECEAALTAIFSEHATTEHLEQHFFDMLDGPLAKAKRVTLNHLCATFRNDSDFDHLHLLVDCHGFDNDGYAY
ncbi:helix-turn-helix domain-containing protein [Aeromonas caviae]|uniref:helix-turn-helix domain-containing protein n=1 Tax=Aeromonas caviae TaxID=648 RepID=UPI0029DC1A15|nr:helix-turn-helix domain-containing protein [Aeromonas caviae]MDX7748194.1 helix-turn-helix domain-containing protein [Aeromonas caviae]MDX7866521.1 helix-turn-helix domain-containing protein [Aeromonas caviae]